MSSLTSPRYVAEVHSSWEPDRVLSYMADFQNAAHWDPSVEQAVRTDAAQGDEISVGSGFDLTVRVGKRASRLQYIITALTSTSVQFTAKTGRLESIDTVTVRPDREGGAIMEYDARLTFLGMARIANPLLAYSLRNLGDRARAGLEQQLNT